MPADRPAQCVGVLADRAHSADAKITYVGDDEDVLAVSSSEEEDGDAIESSGGKKRKRGSTSTKSRKRTSPRQSLPAPPPVVEAEIDSEATIDDSEDDVKPVLPTVKTEPGLAPVPNPAVGWAVDDSDDEEEEWLRPPGWKAQLKAEAKAREAALRSPPPPPEEDSDSSGQERDWFAPPREVKPKIAVKVEVDVKPDIKPTIPVASTSGSQSQTVYPKAQSTHLPNFPIKSAEMDKVKDLPLSKNKLGQVTYLRACINRNLRPYQVRRPSD